MGRYDITSSEGEYQPGSGHKLLRNLPGITDPVEMNIAETDLLKDLYLQVFDNFPEEVTFDTLCQWHRAWLGNIYSWAGGGLSARCTTDPGRAGGAAVSRVVVNQEASVDLPERRERDFRRFSTSSIRSPVSMALELATALRMLTRETDTLPVLFFRTMGRLQNKMISRIITLGRPTVLPAFRRVSQTKVDANNTLLTGPGPRSSIID